MSTPRASRRGWVRGLSYVLLCVLSIVVLTASIMLACVYFRRKS